MNFIVPLTKPAIFYSHAMGLEKNVLLKYTKINLRDKIYFLINILRAKKEGQLRFLNVGQFYKNCFYDAI